MTLRIIGLLAYVLAAAAGLRLLFVTAVECANPYESMGLLFLWLAALLACAYIALELLSKVINKL